MTTSEADRATCRRQRIKTDVSQFMQVNCRRSGTSAVVVATGTIHASNAAMLEHVVDTAARDGLRLVIIDIAAITAVDRDGLSVLAGLPNRSDLLVIVREGPQRQWQGGISRE